MRTAYVNQCNQGNKGAGRTKRRRNDEGDDEKELRVLGN